MTRTRAERRRFAQLPPRVQLLGAGGLAMLLLSACNWLLQDRSTQALYLDHYGGMVAEQLARLSKDAMVREDAIALNVLAEQIASDPAIGAVTVYSLDGRTLASYGLTEPQPASGPDFEPNEAGREFTRAIQLADATAGFVRVTVDPMALDPRGHSLPNSLLKSIRPIAALLLAGLLLWGVVSGLTRESGINKQQSAEIRPKQAAIVLAAQLFNATEMTATRRDAVLAAAETRIAIVADLYGAQHQQLDDNALAVVFVNKENSDQHFHAACAALAIARLCNQPGGARYRYSLQDVELPDPEQMADALLYAALANDNTIAVTSSYARALERPERLQLTSEHSPALTSLQGAPATDYYLLSGANAATEALLDHQINSLRH